MILDALRRQKPEGAKGAGTAAEVRNAVTVESLGLPPFARAATETTAMKLAVVNRCIEVISDSVGKMPSYAMNSATRERKQPKILDLLNTRPNEAMTPFIRRKVLEINRLTRGRGVEWILRDPITMEPRELIPIPSNLVTPWRDATGKVWYDVTHPYTGEAMTLRQEDVLDYKGYTRDGLNCLSVLERAAEIIEAGTAAQEFQGSFFQNGGQPAGVLQTETDLGGYVPGTDPPVTKKDAMRREWEKTHGGPINSYRIAILDHGLKYTPISSTMADAQFVETHDVTVQDICNFFGVPLYKVNAGKQSYSSNEQNAIEYVTGTLHPIVTQYEQEQSWKLLLPSQRKAGLELCLNMMVELRGDFSSRANWYKTMRELGVYSVNDIRHEEDRPDVAGGDSRYASWNYGPLEQWEDLSVRRAQRNGQARGEAE